MSASKLMFTGATVGVFLGFAREDSNATRCIVSALRVKGLGWWVAQSRSHDGGLK